eukprot:CAMPEP_0119572754 /NCGR_PEP_ID=MMETSP1352-20130426/44780_1 /TAXON_ID=265584 /ORGANISM="Stauroneis constricta, Strain CCMP1120" /LENGTH=1373 /DNA_ID=CAMNT_0007622441 /DNA_START=171 /DNA_END=4288 /DNA_ORIENTATION=+
MGQCQSNPDAQASRSVESPVSPKRTAASSNGNRQAAPASKPKKRRGLKKKLAILASKASPAKRRSEAASPSENTEATTPASRCSPTSAISDASHAHGVGNSASNSTSNNTSNGNDQYSQYPQGDIDVSPDAGSYAYSEDSNSIATNNSRRTASSALAALKEEDEGDSSSGRSSAPSFKGTTVQVGSQSLALVDFCDLIKLQSGGNQQHDQQLTSHHGATSLSKANSRRMGMAEDDSLVAPSDEESLKPPSRRLVRMSSTPSDDESSLEPNLKRSTLAKPRALRKSRSRGHKSKSKNSKSLADEKAIGSSPERALRATNARLLGQRVTQASSIIHRQHAASSVPSMIGADSAEEAADLPKESVNDHTLSDFNKLKLQVQLAKRADHQQRKKNKVKERLDDIQGNKSLWNQFEQIENQVRESDTESLVGSKPKKASAKQPISSSSSSPSSSPPSQLPSQEASSQANKGHKRADSMDLQNSSSWYFDFSMLRAQEAMRAASAQQQPREINSVTGTKGIGGGIGLGIGSGVDDDDNRSQSNFSLLSGASMEAQKRLFEEKRRERRNRRKDKGHKGKSKWKRKSQLKFDDDGSVSSFNTNASRLSQDASAFKGQTEEGDYGPPRRISGYSSGTGFEHDSDEDTPPRANSCRLDLDDDNASQISGYSQEPDAPLPEGDYQVVRRRRRRPSYQGQDWDDDSSISTYDNNWKEQITRDLEHARSLRSEPPTSRPTPVTLEIRAFAKKEPMQKYGFDPSAPLSAQLDALTARINDLNQNDASDTPQTIRWSNFENPLTQTSRGSGDKHSGSNIGNNNDYDDDDDFDNDKHNDLNNLRDKTNMVAKALELATDDDDEPPKMIHTHTTMTETTTASTTSAGLPSVVSTSVPVDVDAIEDCDLDGDGPPPTPSPSAQTDKENELRPEPTLKADKINITTEAKSTHEDVAKPSTATEQDIAAATTTAVKSVVEATGTAAMKSPPSENEETAEEEQKPEAKPSFGSPLGSYNPDLAMMSSDAFLFMAAAASAPPHFDTDDDQVNGNADNVANNNHIDGGAGQNENVDNDEEEPIVDDFVERLRAAKQRHKKQRAAAAAAAAVTERPDVATAPKYDSTFSMLSTQDFLCFSDRYSMEAETAESELSDEIDSPPQTQVGTSYTAAADAATTNMVETISDGGKENSKASSSTVSDLECSMSLESNRSQSHRVLHTGEIISSELPVPPRSALDEVHDEPLLPQNVSVISMTDVDDAVRDDNDGHGDAINDGTALVGNDKLTPNPANVAMCNNDVHIDDYDDIDDDIDDVLHSGNGNKDDICNPDAIIDDLEAIEMLTRSEQEQDAIDDEGMFGAVDHSPSKRSETDISHNSLEMAEAVNDQVEELLNKYRS